MKIVYFLTTFRTIKQTEKEKRDESRRYTNVCHAWAKLHERINTEKKHERRTRLCSNVEDGTRSANDVYRLGR